MVPDTDATEVGDSSYLKPPVTSAQFVVMPGPNPAIPQKANSGDAPLQSATSSEPVTVGIRLDSRCAHASAPNIVRVSEMGARIWLPMREVVLDALNASMMAANGPLVSVHPPTRELT